MLRNIANKLELIVKLITGLTFLFIFIINIYQIMVRYFANISYTWVPDISLMLFIWVIFLGGAAAFYRHEHLRLDFLMERLHGKAKQALELGFTVLETIIFIIFIFYGYQVAMVRMGIYFTGIEIPSGIGFLAIPAGGLLMLFFKIVNLTGNHEK